MDDLAAEEGVDPVGRTVSALFAGVLVLGAALPLAGCAGGESVEAKKARTTDCRKVAEPATHPNRRAPYPELALDPHRRYIVQLETNCGQIGVELAVGAAPQTASSFAWLVKRGFYNGLTFHRVVSGFVIQGGDPNGNGTGGPGYTVVEPPPPDLRYTRGTVAMAKAAREPAGASGSQFFIVTAANAGLPPEYALIGHVVSGEEVVSRIEHVATRPGLDGEDSSPAEPIVIEKATLEEPPGGG